MRNQRLAGLGAMAIWLAWSLYSQDGPVFRAETALVHLEAEVTAGNGRILGGLRREDFTIFRDGEKQEIDLFFSEEQPLDLLLLLDTSGSMRRRLQQVSAAANKTFGLLRARDRVSIMIFDDDSQLVLWPTEDLISVEQCLKRIVSRPFNGGTRIQAAVVNAAKHLRWPETEDRRRRAVLIVTDNFGRPSHQGKAAIQELREQDASLNGIVVSKRSSLAQLLGGAGGGIKNIVEKTGGDWIRSSDLQTDLPLILQRIRSRYSLYYKLPEGASDQAQINRVELSSEAQKHYPGAQVATAGGYASHVRDSHGFIIR